MERYPNIISFCRTPSKETCYSNKALHVTTLNRNGVISSENCDRVFAHAYLAGKMLEVMQKGLDGLGVSDEERTNLDIYIKKDGTIEAAPSGEVCGYLRMNSIRDHGTWDY